MDKVLEDKLKELKDLSLTLNELFCPGLARDLVNQTRVQIAENLAICVQFYWDIFENSRDSWFEFNQIRTRSCEILRTRYGLTTSGIWDVILPYINDENALSSYSTRQAVLFSAKQGFPLVV